jgi:hypothetical protein
VEIAMKANELSHGRRADVLAILAAAFDEANQRAEAIATAQKALDLAVQMKQQRLAEALREQLRSYQSQSPQR